MYPGYLLGNRTQFLGPMTSVVSRLLRVLIRMLFRINSIRWLKPLIQMIIMTYRLSRLYRMKLMTSWKRWCSVDLVYEKVWKLK